MRVAMVGSGYVGLVSAACFSDFGHFVCCIDLDREKIATLESGIIPIYEPGLQDIVSRNTAAGRLTFTADIRTGIENVDVIFIAVGTPTVAGQDSPDLSFVFSAANDIADAVTGPCLVVTKSTVPVGTGDSLSELFAAKRPDIDLEVASNPEFLREGSAIVDFKIPDRVIIGVESDTAADVLQKLYRPLFLNRTPIVVTTRRTAELIKYAANSYLATKISFINQIADFCEVVGADVQDVALGIGLDGRIGRKFLHPGPGFGGSCFPKDTRALAAAGRLSGRSFSIVDAVIRENDQRKIEMGRRIMAAAGVGRSIAILGLTFKQNTDDMREAPSLIVVPMLLEAGYTVRAFDPAGMPNAAKLMPGLTLAENPYDCAADADVLVILTEWDQFRALDLERIFLAMRQKVLVDLRNLYPLQEMKRFGFHYVSIGRPELRPNKDSAAQLRENDSRGV